jgi:hypothetical protein
MLTPCDLLKRTPWFVVILPFSGFQGGSTGSNPVGGAGTCMCESADMIRIRASLGQDSALVPIDARTPAPPPRSSTIIGCRIRPFRRLPRAPQVGSAGVHLVGG